MENRVVTIEEVPAGGYVVSTNFRDGWRGTVRRVAIASTPDDLIAVIRGALIDKGEVPSDDQRQFAQR